MIHQRFAGTIGVDVDDLELLEAIEDRIDLAAARKAMKEPGSKRWEDVKKELGW